MNCGGVKRLCRPGALGSWAGHTFIMVVDSSLGRWERGYRYGHLGWSRSRCRQPLYSKVCMHAVPGFDAGLCCKQTSRGRGASAHVTLYARVPRPQPSRVKHHHSPPLHSTPPIFPSPSSPLLYFIIPHQALSEHPIVRNHEVGDAPRSGYAAGRRER